MSTPGIYVRREGNRVAIEDYDVEHGKAVLIRISIIDGPTAVRLGQALMLFGTEVSREGTKTLKLLPHADPYPEDRSP